MQLFLPSTFALMSLIYVLQALVMIIGLRRTQGQAAYKPWLLVAFWGSLFWQATGFVNSSLHPDLMKSLSRYSIIIFSGSLYVFLIANMQLAYLFPVSAFEQERKGVVRTFSVLCLVCLGLLIWYNFFPHAQITNSLNGLLVMLSVIWTLLTYIRKARYFRQRNPAIVQPNLLLASADVGIIMLSLLFVYPGSNHPLVLPIYFFIGWPLFQYRYLIYILYSAFPIRFQDKLVGFAFVTVITMLTYTILLLIPYTHTIADRIAHQHELRMLTLIILGSAVFVLWVFPVILRVSLVRPLGKLLTGIKQVNEGDLSVQVPVGILDEFGALTQNFNQMTQSLKQSKEELTQYAETLEVKVSDRTAELVTQKEVLQTTLDHLKSTQTQLIQKEKMASLGELTAGIAHEIQNPLNFVNNFSEVSTELVTDLKDELDRGDTDEAKAIADDLTQNLQKITHHGSRASAIVRGMLEHSRTSTGEKRPTNLNTLADEYLKIAYQGWQSKDNAFQCELVTDFDPDLGLADVVPQEIGRVLVNLYNNGFYAISQKQQTAPAEYQPTVTVSTAQVDGQVEIRVGDNGTGIPEAVKAKIFQPFFTTKPTGEGTGLGLSLSYDIVTKGHGGKLTVESSEGKGTDFILKLPPKTN